MKLADWCGHTWIIIGFKGRMLMVLGAPQCSRILNTDQVFSELPLLPSRLMQLCITTASSGVLAPKAQSSCPITAMSGVFVCLCVYVHVLVRVFVLPVTGSLMLVTAVGSEQKAVYFQCSSPTHPPDACTYTHTVWVSWKSGKIWSSCCVEQSWECSLFLG